LLETWIRDDTAPSADATDASSAAGAARIAELERLDDALELDILLDVSVTFRIQASLHACRLHT
jgi:hypothetical protein